MNAKFEQIIRCPNCEGVGWVRDGGTPCPVCDARGRLVIDGKSTADLLILHRPAPGRMKCS